MLDILMIGDEDMAKKQGRKKSPRSAFGARLLNIRKQRGLTQEELGAKVGLSNRMIAHYERHGERIPVNHLTNFARALTVTVDALLGIQEIKATGSPKTARLLNRLRRVETLPEKDRRAVLDYVDALFSKQQLHSMAKK